MVIIKLLKKYWWLVTLFCIIIIGIVLLPIPAKMMLINPENHTSMLWPKMELKPENPKPGETVELIIYDVIPWIHVIITLDGITYEPFEYESKEDALYTWKWRFVLPEGEGHEIVFYHNSDTGAIERARTMIGGKTKKEKSEHFLPTKLGVFLANPQRDWYGRSGWNLELTYVKKDKDKYWCVNDLAHRVSESAEKGLRVLVRIDYDTGHSIPRKNDKLALSEYLAFLRRLARDQRLKDVYAYIIGSGYNKCTIEDKQEKKNITPGWYARVLIGFKEKPSHTDNVIQVMKAEDPCVRIFVGPLTPWISDQTGNRVYPLDTPWLNYMNTLVWAIHKTTIEKSDNGISMVLPDGFAIPCPGRPGAFDNNNAYKEPTLDLRLSQWHGAQGGFRIFEDWMNIINSYHTTKGLPLFIVTTNTFCIDEGIPPAQNYPAGWLATALDVINKEPQIKGMVWFLDYFPHGTAWEYFSLTRKKGNMLYASEDFESLLQ